MKAKGIFISSLLVIDTFLASYYFGLHSRTFKIIDPKMPALEEKKQETKSDTTNKEAEGTSAVPVNTKEKPEGKAKDQDKTIIPNSSKKEANAGKKEPKPEKKSDSKSKKSKSVKKKEKKSNKASHKKPNKD